MEEYINYSEACLHWMTGHVEQIVNQGKNSGDLMEILNVNYAEIKLKTESTPSLIALFPRDYRELLCVGVW